MRVIFALVLSSIPIVSAEAFFRPDNISHFKVNSIYSVFILNVDCNIDNVSKFSLVGRMHGHSHGMPTSPIITFDSGINECVVDGLSFSMKGKWILDLKLDGKSRAKRIVNVD